MIQLNFAARSTTRDFRIKLVLNSSFIVQRSSFNSSFIIHHSSFRIHHLFLTVPGETA